MPWCGAGPVDTLEATLEQRRHIIRPLVMAAVALADAYTQAADAG